jgi:hypothetical protein
LWETHAMPEIGSRPQAAINRQLLVDCDLLVGMFWTRLGTNTGAAESGTVEEIDQFVRSSRPAMLYFSRRPVDPTKIDSQQHDRLRQFQRETCQRALTGSFNSLDDLRHILLRDLTRQVRSIAPDRPKSRRSRLDNAFRITELIRVHREHQITPEEFKRYEQDFLPRPSKAVVTDSAGSDEIGPNGHRVGYTADGDKVEWLPNEDNPGQEWPMILRRGDKAILVAHEEFWERCGGIDTRAGFVGLKPAKSRSPRLKSQF